MLAKMSDVVADSSPSKSKTHQLAQEADKMYDVMADGSFTKLICTFVLGVSSFGSRGMSLPM